MGSFKGDVNSRRIDRAYQYIGKPWFPINLEVVKRITEGLKNGSFESNPNLLIEELRSDFALLAFTIKELYTGTLKLPDYSAKRTNPIELIRSNGAKTLRELIAHRRLPSTHSLHWSEPFQLQRLRETAVAASTASLLSGTRSLDPELGFTRGIMRQVGLSLVAWNYPSVYQKALQDTASESSIDERLNRSLGFSPTMLGTLVFSPEKANNSEQTESSDAAWADYDALCEVGEIVARSESPEHHPQAVADWHRAHEVLQEKLGPSAIDDIREHAISRTATYQRALPEIFTSISTFDPSASVRRYRRVRRATSNMYFGSCPENVRAALISFYADLPDDEVDKAMVGRLLKEVVPEAGFTGGCVFVVDEDSSSLKPKTLIGKMQMRPMSSGVVDPGDPAISAFLGSEPVVENGAGSDKAQLAGIYGSIGSSRKIGVLYLESPQIIAAPPSQETLGTFHALKQALADALMLE
jgi:hypothetical protein